MRAPPPGARPGRAPAPRHVLSDDDRAVEETAALAAAAAAAAASGAVSPTVQAVLRRDGSPDADAMSTGSAAAARVVPSPRHSPASAAAASSVPSQHTAQMAYNRMVSADIMEAAAAAEGGATFSLPASPSARSYSHYPVLRESVSGSGSVAPSSALRSMSHRPVGFRLPDASDPQGSTGVQFDAARGHLGARRSPISPSAQLRYARGSSIAYRRDGSGSTASMPEEPKRRAAGISAAAMSIGRFPFHNFKGKHVESAFHRRQWDGSAWLRAGSATILACENLCRCFVRSFALGWTAGAMVLTAAGTIAALSLATVAVQPRAPRRRYWNIAVLVVIAVHLFVCDSFGGLVGCTSDGAVDLSTAPEWGLELGYSWQMVIYPPCYEHLGSSSLAMFWHPMWSVLRWGVSATAFLASDWWTGIMVCIPAYLCSLALDTATPESQAGTPLMAVLTAIIIGLPALSAYRYEVAARHNFRNLLLLGSYLEGLERVQAKVLHRERQVAAVGAELASQSKLTSMLSHELRNPLHGCIGFVDGFVHNPELPDSMRDDMLMVARSCDRMAAILNDALDLSKLRAGKIMMDPSPTDVRSLVADSVRHVRAWLPRGVAVNIETSLDVPDSLVVDPIRFSQIIDNALSNAGKQTRHGTITVRLSARPAPPGGWAKGSEPLMSAALPSREPEFLPSVLLQCEVTDEGPGITKAQGEAAFDEYSQFGHQQQASERRAVHSGLSVTSDAEDDARKASGVKAGFMRGTGLGLPIARRLAEALHGSIGLEGRSDGTRGARFWFSVPCYIASSSMHTAALAAAGEVSKDTPLGLHCLCADDEMVNRRLLARMLKALGCHATMLTDGDEVEPELTRLGAPNYDVVLLDIIMERTNGEQVCRQLLSSGFDTMPIIAVTGNALDSDVARYHSVGFCDVLRKPFTRAALRESLLRATAPPPAASDALKSAHTRNPSTSGSMTFDEENHAAAHAGVMASWRSSPRAPAASASVRSRLSEVGMASLPGAIEEPGDEERWA